MADWFSENFVIGSPLRDPIGSLGTSWHYYDGGHTSQYAKLIQARDPGAEIHNTYGISGTPALYSSDPYAGRSMNSIWALSGTASARQLTTPGAFVLNFQVKFIGVSYENMSIALYGSVAMWQSDLNIHFEYSGSNLICYVEYQKPNGTNFGITFDYSTDYVIGAKGTWRTGGLWHAIQVKVQPGTVTTWIPGTYSSEDTYTGGSLAVASDGYIKVFIDAVEVITLTGVPLITNFDGQSANESSPGSWLPASRGTVANVNSLSIIDMSILSGSAIIDSVTLGPLEVWVDIPNWHAHEYLDASQYPGGVARCFCDLWTTESGVMVQARLVSLLADGSVDAVVGTSAEITAIVPTDATFAVTLTGNKQHKLQLTSDTPNTDLWCSPDAKVTA